MEGMGPLPHGRWKKSLPPGQHLSNLSVSLRASGRSKHLCQYRERSGALTAGVRTIADPVVAELVAGLPNDDYLVCLSEATPQLVIPGQPDDYFVNEQVALWGINQFWNLPHDPRVPYYRAGEMNLGNGKKLFHFVIPMFPENWLDKKVVSEYVQRFEAGDSPTAVSISCSTSKGRPTGKARSIQ